ncbi:RsmF rRNA methyltransferase first C-terminal domain-containing protein [Bombilactobacillus folatiphilus]|uniref:RsmF rRNA methyltransferase first C-terminal domain-containing protein n=1 Tax=Bombilactobacillus folatiphilus TaxID=2923362 RepID=A0ABY4P7K3_9LACO|nr:RsmF rRNA methyltransferase first C-terminal domain-containing protein [Bombilactobacillus folatiphilus]UQS81504.1 RsmF rRNA methyltransferase first C-terminal domain-containing protein [Bombilactobacillus folatiphilus]
MNTDLPKEFQEKYQQLLGTQAPAFFKSFFESSTHGFRLNPEKVQSNLVNEPLNQPILSVLNGYYGQISGADIDHSAGWLYSQDPSAMNVAQFADPHAHERVLDLCAAPGGKSTQLAALMAGSGILVANEIDAKRARVLSSNIERWGSTNVVVTNNTPEQLNKVFPEFFDCIVVDAPCSGEGLFRKDPEAKAYWSPQYVVECANRQRTILTMAVSMLRPGGRLIYSTCTFSPEENEQNMDWLTQNYELEIIDLKHYAGMDHGQPAWGNNNQDLSKAVRLFPHHYAGEGHFICALQKRQTAVVKNDRDKNQVPSKVKRRNSVRQQHAEFQLWEQFQQQTLRKFVPSQLQIYNDVLYDVALVSKDLTSLHVLRNGLKLGIFKKRRFEPDHALVMALASEQFQKVIDLDAEQFHHFVHGEALILNKSQDYQGWVAVSFEQKIFAWGKLVQQQLKNFYPKGLRQ